MYSEWAHRIHTSLRAESQMCSSIQLNHEHDIKLNTLLLESQAPSVVSHEIALYLTWKILLQHLLLLLSEIFHVESFPMERHIAAKKHF